MNKNFDSLKNLMKFFRIGISKDQQKADIENKVRPLQKNPDGTFSPENFPPHVERLYKIWLNTKVDINKYTGMRFVWEDMDLVYSSCSLIKNSVDLMADEAIQADKNPEYIGIEASSRVKDFILNFFDKLSLYSKIRPTLEDLILYGNTGWILSENETEIEEIIQPNIYQFKDILQFTPYELEEQIKGKQRFITQYAAKERIDKLIQSIVEKNNYSSYFKKYIIGYQIGDYVLPPWKFLHFKNATSKLPFDPFGIPVFIHSIAPYKQYDAAMTMQMILRGANIPTEIFEISAPNVIDPVSKLNIVTTFLRNFQNSGFSTTRKEEKGVGEVVFTIKDLFDYRVDSPDIDIGKIGDLEMLYDEIIISTELPRHLIDPHDSGFGESGISLMEQFKPFARRIYRLQSIMLENISQLIKIQMILSGNFSQEEMDFVLTMPYPESQTNPDIITSQESLLDLADKTIELMSDKFLNGEPLPMDLIYSIFSELLPYNQDTLDRWMHYINKEKLDTTDAESIYTEAKNIFLKRKNKNNYRNFIFKQKVKNLKEGVLNNKHYFSSINRNPIFWAEKLNEWSIEDASKLLMEEVKKD